MEAGHPFGARGRYFGGAQVKKGIPNVKALMLLLLSFSPGTEILAYMDNTWGDSRGSSMATVV